MSARDDLRAAAAELVNCEASSDANADEQLRLAAALRALAGRLEDELHDAKVGADMGLESSRYKALARLDDLDAPLQKAKP